MERAGVAHWTKRAQAVADLLPTISAGWTVQELTGFNDKVLITNSAGLSFTFGKSGYNAESSRIVITHHEESKYIPHGTPEPRITVDIDRDPKGIARDIENKLLTPLSELALIVEGERERQEKRNADFRLAVEMLNEAGAGAFHVEQTYETEAKISTANYHQIDYYVHEASVSEKSARISFESLDHEELATIFRALRALREARAGQYEDETAQQFRAALAA